MTFLWREPNNKTDDINPFLEEVAVHHKFFSKLVMFGTLLSNAAIFASGAMITFDHGGKDGLMIWSTNPVFIQEAKSQLYNYDPSVHPCLKLLDDKGVDINHDWHVDSIDHEWTEVSAEGLHGRPNFVDTNKQYWLALGRLCMPRAQVTNVEQR